MTPDELLTWLSEKLRKARYAARARRQAAETWASGSDDGWRKAGFLITAKERLKESKSEARIAMKYERDVRAIEALIAMVEATAGQRTL